MARTLFVPTEEQLQTVFEYVKHNNCLHTHELISAALGIGRNHVAKLCKALVARGLLRDIHNGKKGRTEYQLTEKGQAISSIAEAKISLNNGHGMVGRCFVDKWVANHPLAGVVPYSISQQGIEAMQRWLVEADQRGGKSQGNV